MNRQNGVSALKIKANESLGYGNDSWYSSADIISLTSEEAYKWLEKREQQKP